MEAGDEAADGCRWDEVTDDCWLPEEKKKFE